MEAAQAQGDDMQAKGPGLVGDLSAAFETLEDLPAHSEGRDRLLRALAAGGLGRGEAAAAVEADVALTVAVLRRAAKPGNTIKGGIASVPRAIQELAPTEIEAAARASGEFDFLDEGPGCGAVWAPFRFHAAAVKHAAECLCGETGREDRDELVVAALLHDIGKLALSETVSGYPGRIHAGAKTPEQRIRKERHKLGVDHAVVGGVLARHWGLPEELASAIEAHHSAERDGPALLIRLADMLANYGHGRSVDLRKLATLAGRLGLSRHSLSRLMYELPFSLTTTPARVESCPLSSRELEVLRLLSNGKVYKQIGTELEISTATVRSHLHRTYGKLGVVDRAQAVLIGSRKGWLASSEGSAPALRQRG